MFQYAAKLIKVVDGDLKSVNAQMVEAKLAKAYTGGVREPFSGE